MLYYPLSSKEFTFENIFSTESISPPIFYPIRNFGISYFHALPKVNLENVITLYSSPPKYEVESGIRFMIKIDERSLNEEDLIFIEEGIFGYPKTIFLRKDNFKLLFFNEKDLKVSVLKSRNSLPTKSVEKYIENFEVVSEKDCVLYNNKVVELERSTIDIRLYALEDKKFDHFKGFIYGIVSGQYDKSTQSGASFKKAHRELINVFAEFKSRLSELEKFSLGYSKFRGMIRVEYLNNLEKAIDNLEREYYKSIQENDLSKIELIKFLFDNYFTITSLEMAEQYVNYKLINDEVFGTADYDNLKKIASNKIVSSNNITLFSDLRSQIFSFIENINSNKIKYLEEQNIKIKSILNKIETTYINSTQKTEGSFNIRLENIGYSFKENEIQVEEKFSGLNDEEVKDVIVITNKILYHTIQGESKGKELILRIVEDAGNHFGDNSKQTNLYQYLNHQVDEYSLEKVVNPVLKNFVAFIFNFESLEKLQNFIINKNVKESWIAFGFWGALNGFANLSGNFTNCIFNNNGILMQNYLDGYLKSYLDILKDFNSRENQINSLNEGKEVYLSSAEIADAIDGFYQKFIAGNYNLTKDQFSSVYLIKDKDTFYHEVKSRFNINKKTSEKLFNIIKRDFTSPSLFI